jgi:hypothetical protein
MVALRSSALSRRSFSIPREIQQGPVHGRRKMPNSCSEFVTSNLELASPFYPDSQKRKEILIGRKRNISRKTSPTDLEQHAAICHLHQRACVVGRPRVSCHGMQPSSGQRRPVLLADYFSSFLLDANSPTVRGGPVSDGSELYGRRGGVLEGALYSRPQQPQQSLGRRRFASDSKKEPPSGTKGGLQAAKPSGHGTAVTVAQKVPPPPLPPLPVLVVVGAFITGGEPAITRGRCLTTGAARGGVGGGWRGRWWRGARTRGTGW